MINQQLFQSADVVEQRNYLISIVGNIETTVNKSLILCQRLLQIIPNPSAKLLGYIYDVIAGQLQVYHTQEVQGQQQSLIALQNYIASEEAKEQEHVDDILGAL